MIDKELQCLAWRCLPREFREGVKRMWSVEVDCATKYKSELHKHRTDLLYELFGAHLHWQHNLTSDAEGDEMLTCEKSKGMQIYSHLLDLVENERMSEHYSEWCDLEREYIALFGENVFADYSGSKCLPDKKGVDLAKIDKQLDDTLAKETTESLNEWIDSKAEPKPSEPKFKVNDVVRTVFNEITHITSVLGNGNYYLYGMGNEYPEDSLTLIQPYTKPTKEGTRQEQCVPQKAESGARSFDTILKDGFSKERRLNIAKDFVSVLLGRLNYAPFVAQINCCCLDGEAVNPYINIARIALSAADALITEPKKGETI